MLDWIDGLLNPDSDPVWCIGLWLTDNPFSKVDFGLQWVITWWKDSKFVTFALKAEEADVDEGVGEVTVVTVPPLMEAILLILFC